MTTRQRVRFPGSPRTRTGLSTSLSAIAVCTCLLGSCRPVSREQHLESQIASQIAMPSPYKAEGIYFGGTAGDGPPLVKFSTESALAVDASVPTLPQGYQLDPSQQRGGTDELAVWTGPASNEGGVCNIHMLVKAAGTRVWFLVVCDPAASSS